MTPSHGNDTAEPAAFSAPARQRIEREVRAGPERLTGTDRKLIPLIDGLVAVLHRECARRRLELRAAQQEIEQLRSALDKQTTSQESR